MRILVAHHRYRVRGGEDEAVDREIALLREAGIEVELWERDSKEITGLIARIKAAQEMPYSEESRDELSAIISRFRPDLVHVHNFFPTFTPSIYDACIAANVPIIQTLHNFRIFCASGLLARDGKPCDLCLAGSTLPALRYSCYKDSRFSTLILTRMIQLHRRADTWNKKVDAFIALSKFSADKLAQGGLRPEKIHVKSNFAFPSHLDVKRTSEGYALYVGRFSEEKGIRTLLEAWEGVRFPLWMVGEGPLREVIEKKKNPFIKIMGAMPSHSVMRIMSKSDFLIVPSECYENFPVVVAEAFSLGLPVVASKLGSLAEIVRHGKNGLLFEPGNAALLREAVNLIAGNKTMLEELSKVATADYLAKYTPQKNLEVLLEIYRSAINSKQNRKKNRDSSVSL